MIQGGFNHHRITQVYDCGSWPPTPSAVLRATVTFYDSELVWPAAGLTSPFSRHSPDLLCTLLPLRIVVYCIPRHVLYRVIQNMNIRMDIHFFVCFECSNLEFLKKRNELDSF